MHYLIVSFSHKNSSLAQREKLAFVDDTMKKAMMQRINESSHINETLLLSTCNRVEVICSCSDVEEAQSHILHLLSDHAKETVASLKERADILDGYGAIHHLFSVASSLDSMVVGETQITGQLRDAHKLANESGFCGIKIARAMQFASKCAAEIRNVTDISSKPVSVASVAVNRAKELLGTLEGVRALVIGSGEMSVITCKHLISQGAVATVMNRTYAKAEEIADECGCDVRPFEELTQAIGEYPLLFTSTGSLTPIIDESHLQECPFERFWFDMAVPRDIDCPSEAGKINVVQMDDLKSIVSANIALREDEARTSFVLVGRYAASFFEWLKALSIEPLIKGMYTIAYQAAYEEASRVIDKGFIPKEYEYALHKATQQALKRFLHPLSERMRDNSDPSATDALMSTMEFLLHEDDDYSSSLFKSHKGN